MTSQQQCGGPAQARTCMGIVDEAARLERLGKPVVHLEKGELDLDTHDLVKESAIQALRKNRTRYSHSSGLPELRQAISDYYGRVYGVDVNPARVVVNSGSSAAMLELFLALLEPGDEVVIPDPGYPAYPSLIEAARGRAVRAAAAGHGYVHTAELAADHLTSSTKALLINFPSNPVGSLAGPDELRAFAELGPLVVADEVYHGLAFSDERPHTILEYTGDAVSVGSFSKSFAMTGWRLGYVIVPESLRSRLTRMHEYLFVGSNTFAQWGAVTALENAEAIQKQIRDELRGRQECLRDALSHSGLRPVYEPRGGFYTLVHQPEGTGSSAAFAARLLEHAHVALTPGSEFGPSGEGCVRFSLSAPREQIREGLQRITTFLHSSAEGSP
ncbi:pyridoxal phosphate-dependent aminotransferase [Nonomuraea candida]|uniref:pyridoxal phosphate-dependent aminotransferase n=1 Tax=Nonomuraea candida TaxID=359159 RepID=UPI0005B7C893|nr:aminotransferase class I/II-fold pyridoxal phosphate-dependent enzyme [Nonomuraea candida]